MHKVLRIVWGNQKGFVFISTKNRVTGRWRDKPFRWPEDKDIIQDYIEDHEDHDLYWAPVVFKDEHRQEKYAKNPNYLYADLDLVPPGRCRIKPSIAWQSSPGRYQAIWLLSEALKPKVMAGLNKRLTYHEGADKSGWDLTQVLRIPGTINYKYSSAPRGKLLWAKRIFFDPVDIDNQIPEISMSSSLDTEVDIEDSELRELIWPYRRYIGTRLWEMLFTPDSEIKEGERSDRLWELECRLIESNVPVSEVFKIAKASPWNKYKGRKDEDKRILTEVLKAEESVRKGPIRAGEDIGISWTSYSNFIGRRISGPGWLVEGFWANASHGMIAGEPKTYKSLIATEIAVSVASGFPMWNQYKVLNPGPVLYLQEENPAWVVQDRIIKIAHSKDLLKGNVYKMRLDHVLYLEFPKNLPLYISNNYGFDLTQAGHREDLVRKIEEINPVLLVLDPLYLMLGNLDENSAQELRGVLQWLLQVKEEYRVSIMILHHWNKGGKSDRGGQRMLGSTTLHAWVESAIYTSISNVERNNIIIEREFRSFMKPPLMTASFRLSNPGDEPSYNVGVEELKRIPKKYDGKPKSDKKGILAQLVSAGAASTPELYATHGSSSRQSFRELLKRMKKEGFINELGKDQTGQSSVWTISEGGVKELGRLDLLSATGEEEEEENNEE